MRKIMEKQNIFDFILEHQKEVSPSDLVVILDHYKEIAVMRYPTQFEFTLMSNDFPNRNLIPVYDRNYKVIEWLEGEDPKPGPTLQRFLESGDKNYIPEYKSTRSSKEGKALLHGKYHFGSSANI